MGKLQKGLKGLLAGGAGVAALAAVNALIARDSPAPETGALGGVAGVFDWRYGRIFYRFAGHDALTPVVFIHGIGVGMRSFMWRRNFEPLSNDFRVYAIDLLGFGYSEKPANTPYSSDLYVELIADFLREVVGGRAHIVASSLGAAFAMRVADEHAELVQSLVLISPTGTGNLSARPDLPGAAFYSLLHSPVLGTSFYNAMTSERSIRDYARKQLFYDKRLATRQLIAHYYATSHQPGAQYAMTAFLSGYLNTDTRAAFARLTQDTTLVWGRQDGSNPLEHAARLLSINPRATLEIFDHCRMMPQEEHPDAFNALLHQRFNQRSVVL